MRLSSAWPTPSRRSIRVFWLDSRGEALWDVVILWTMPVAGGLLIVDHGWWPYFGLVGGGSYLYFAGRGIAVRRLLRRGGVRIGSEANVRVGLAALAIWGVMALVTIVAAVVSAGRELTARWT